MLFDGLDDLVMQVVAVVHFHAAARDLFVQPYEAVRTVGKIQDAHSANEGADVLGGEATTCRRPLAPDSSSVTGS